MKRTALSVIGLATLASLKSATEGSEATKKERDLAVESFETLKTAFDETEEKLEATEGRLKTVEKDLEAANAELTTLRAAAAKHAEELAAATAVKKEAEAAIAAMPDKIKAGAAQLCAQQGIELKEVPPTGNVSDSSAEEELKAIVEKINASKDPSEKGKLAEQASEVRKKMREGEKKAA